MATKTLHKNEIDLLEKSGDTYSFLRLGHDTVAILNKEDKVWELYVKTGLALWELKMTLENLDMVRSHG